VDNLKPENHKYKKKKIKKISNKNGLWFHIAGIITIIWFLIRVVPRPDRIRYPCQQMGISVASGYIIFWSILWGSLFHGLGRLTKKLKNKTIVVAPIILVSLIMIFSITSNVFADNYAIKKDNEIDILSRWNPIPNEPIGTPQGVNPGRVAWVWNPNATERVHIGLWYEKQNNNQNVIDEMYSQGIQGLAGIDNDSEAWDSLFRYFNLNHDKGDIGYQPGEKIAIKINMVYCFINPYDYKERRINANPYVVKSLLRQLIDKVGVAQEDIILFDASRNFYDWFYNRVYYKEYPTEPLIPEFPNIHYVDADGGAPGREKVVPSETHVYFADGSCEYRTLPTCITESDYLINIPITKRHMLDYVTLAGKNLFGTFIEEVQPIHPYFFIGCEMGNPAPQTDLLGHEELGKKTLLYVGDGIYAVRYNNAYASFFRMYPFKFDWMNSLFFSQDGVAIDSVMYDFLHAEGTDPSEGTQNYMHQAAIPPADVYDPEGDGIYLSDSLGVHEHWNTSIGIFKPERYIGPSQNGIDFVPIGKEHASSLITLQKLKGKMDLSLWIRNILYGNAPFPINFLNDWKKTPKLNRLPIAHDVEI
jgi:hypothetical protein